MPEHGAESPDLIIVGGGPCGLACGIEATRAGLRHRILEKGALTEAIRRFPTYLRFYSTPELLELGDLPFATPSTHPTRQEALVYYRRVAERYGLDVSLYSEVIGIRSGEGGFTVETAAGDRLAARSVVVATGYYDTPNRAGIPGEDLPHVAHYYTEPFPYARSRVVVVGGGNSAVEAALDLYRGGAAEVHLVHRRSGLKPTVKYWIRPDIENRIREGSIDARFDTTVRAIREREVEIEGVETGEREILPADFVLLLTGYHPDPTLLRGAGVLVDETTLVPVHDPETLETSVPGLYIGGSVVSGRETGRIFIENGRDHARRIVAHVRERVAR